MCYPSDKEQHEVAASNDQKEFIRDLKQVYRAASEEIALVELEHMMDKWGKKYGMVLDSWVNNWENISTYFGYGPHIRKLIYTTNTLEGFSRQLRKLTKTRTVYPTDDSLKKNLYLATNEISRKWTQVYRNWGQTMSEFIIFSEGKLSL